MLNLILRGYNGQYVVLQGKREGLAITIRMFAGPDVTVTLLRDEMRRVRDFLTQILDETKDW